MRFCSLLFTSLLVSACTSQKPAESIIAQDEASQTEETSSLVEDTLSGPAREACKIAAVTDGDSLRCTDDRRIRLLLLDAPEMDQHPFGTMSRDALRTVINRGDSIWLEYDVEKQDRYGRTLAHVWTSRTGGTHVNMEQARKGWAVAVVYPPNVRYIENIRAAVADARKNGVGLWATGEFTCDPVAHKRGNC